MHRHSRTHSNFNSNSLSPSIAVPRDDKITKLAQSKAERQKRHSTWKGSGIKWTEVCAKFKFPPTSPSLLASSQPSQSQSSSALLSTSPSPSPSPPPTSPPLSPVEGSAQSPNGTLSRNGSNMQLSSYDLFILEELQWRKEMLKLDNIYDIPRIETHFHSIFQRPSHPFLPLLSTFISTFLTYYSPLLPSLTPQHAALLLSNAVYECHQFANSFSNTVFSLYPEVYSKEAVQAIQYVAMEYILPSIHPVLFELYLKKNVQADTQWKWRLSNLKSVNLADLGLSGPLRLDADHAPEPETSSETEISESEPESVAPSQSPSTPSEPYAEAIPIIRQIIYEVTSRTKLEVLATFSKSICSCVDEYYKNLPPNRMRPNKSQLFINADDLLSILSYCILRSQCQHLPSTVAFIEDFIGPSLRVSQPGYYLAVLQAAVELIGRLSPSLFTGPNPIIPRALSAHLPDVAPLHQPSNPWDDDELPEDGKVTLENGASTLDDVTIVNYHFRIPTLIEAEDPKPASSSK